MIYKLLMGIMIFNLAGALWVFWLLFHPIQLSIIYNEPFPVYPNPVERGEKLHYEIEFLKRDNYHVETNKNIVCDDGTLITLSAIDTNAPIGSHKAVGSITIPDTTSLTSCYLELKPKYHINEIRIEERILRTQPFMVIG